MVWEISTHLELSGGASLFCRTDSISKVGIEWCGAMISTLCSCLLENQHCATEAPSKCRISSVIWTMPGRRIQSICSEGSDSKPHHTRPQTPPCDPNGPVSIVMAQSVIFSQRLERQLTLYSTDNPLGWLVRSLKNLASVACFANFNLVICSKNRANPLEVLCRLGRRINITRHLLVQFGRTHAHSKVGHE
jgi:hypothetical protein